MGDTPDATLAQGRVLRRGTPGNDTARDGSRSRRAIADAHASVAGDGSDEAIPSRRVGQRSLARDHRAQDHGVGRSLLRVGDAVAAGHVHTRSDDGRGRRSRGGLRAAARARSRSGSRSCCSPSPCSPPSSPRTPPHPGAFVSVLPRWDPGQVPYGSSIDDSQFIAPTPGVVPTRSGGQRSPGQFACFAMQSTVRPAREERGTARCPAPGARP